MKTLTSYDLKNGDVLLWKKKHRPIKVRLLDASVKAILLDESLPVQQLVEKIGEAINLTNPEEFSLKVEGQQQWLNSMADLAGNGVPDDAILEIRRKYWFADVNITVESPMELHLLYIEANKMVLEGSLPTERNEAVDLAALMCLIVFKKYDPERCNKKGWLDPVKFLPPAYHKKKLLPEMEKDVRREFMKHSGMTEPNAKYRYVQLCRSLPTWGMTHYLVQEKVVSGKNGQKVEWVDVRLAVLRDSIIVMDPVTFKILKSWELEKIKRFAASPRSFTLDFGDNEQDYYIVQTLEGDAIRAQIAGYIDIILKRRREAPGASTANTTKTPQITQVKPVHGITVVGTTLARAQGGQPVYGPDGSLMDPSGNTLGYGYGPGGVGFMGGDLVGVSGMALDGAAGITDLNGAIAGIDSFLGQLGLPGGTFNIPDMSPEAIWQTFSESYMGCQRGALQLIDAAYGGGDLDALSPDLARNVAAMINAAKLAGRTGDNNISLLSGAHALAEAIYKTLQCSREVQMNPTDAARLSLWSAKENMKSAQLSLEAHAAGFFSDPSTTRLVLASALAVAKASSQLRGVAAEHAVGDPTASTYADLINVMGEHVSATAMTLSRCITHPQAQSLVIDSVGELKKSCGNLILSLKQKGLPHSVLVQVGTSAKGVNDCLNQLLDATKVGADDIGSEVAFQHHLNAIKSHAAVLQSSHSTVDALIASYSNIIPAAQALIQNATLLAGKSDPSFGSVLLNTVAEMQGSAGELRSAIEGVMADPYNLAMKGSVAAEASTLQNASGRLTADAERRLVVIRVRNAAKTAALETIALTNSAPVIPQKSEDLENALHNVQAGITKLIHALKENATNPIDRSTEKELIDSSKNSVAVGSGLVTLAKKGLPAIENPEMRAALKDITDRVSRGLQELIAACAALEDLGGGKQIREAIDQLGGMVAELENAEMNSQVGMLTALPGQNAQSTVQLLEFVSNQVLASLTTYRDTAWHHPEEVGSAATDLAEKVNQTLDASINAARTTRDKNMQKVILLAGKSLAGVAAECLTGGLEVVINPNDERKQANFEDHLRTVREMLAGLLNAAKGLDIEGLNLVVSTIRNTGDQIKIVDGISPAQHDTFLAALRQDSESLQAALSNVCVVAGHNPRGLVPAAKMVGAAFEQFVRNLNNAASSSNDRTAGAQMIVYGKAIANETAMTVSATQVAASEANSDAPALVSSHNNVKAALNDLFGILNPGQSALEESLRRLKSITDLLASAVPFAALPNGLALLDQSTQQLASATAELMEPGINASEMGNRSQNLVGYVEELVKHTKGALAHNPQLGAASNPTSSSAAVDPQSTGVLAQLRELLNLARAIASDPQSGVTNSRNALQICQALIGNPALPHRDLIKVAGDGTSQLVLAVKASASNAPNGAADVSLKSRNLISTLEPLIQRAEAANHASGGGGSLPAMVSATIRSSEELLAATMSVIRQPRNRQPLSGPAKFLSEGITQLVHLIDRLGPGASDMATAIDALQQSIARLDALRFAPKTAPVKSLQTCHEEIHTACLHLNQQVNNLVTGTTAANAQEISTASQYIVQLVGSLCESTGAWIQTSADDKTRNANIDLIKSIADTLLECVTAARRVSKSPDEESRQQLQAAFHTVHSALSTIITKMSGGVVGLAECDNAMQVLATCLQSLSTPLATPSTQSYRLHREAVESRIDNLSLSIAKLMQVSKTNVDQIAVTVKALEAIFPGLYAAIKSAANTSTVNGAKNQIITGADGLTRAVHAMVSTARSIAGEGHVNNPKLAADISQGVSQITQAIIAFRGSIEDADAGRKAISAVLQEFGTLMGTIETASLQAVGGNQFSGSSGGMDVAHAIMVRKCKVLASHATQLCTLFRTNPEDIPACARQFVKSMEEVLQRAQAVAALSPDKFSQQGLFNSAKSVVGAAQQLVMFVKDADPSSASILSEPALLLSDAIEKMVETSRFAAAHIIAGGRALTQSKCVILNALVAQKQPTYQGNPSATPQDIQGAARALAKASGMVSSCLNAPEELAAAAEASAEAVTQLAAAGKGCLRLTPDRDIQAGVSDNAEVVSRAAYGLLTVVQKQQGSIDPQAQRAVASAAERLSEGLLDLLNSARRLPGGSNLELEEDDLANTAQRELDAAAAKIEEATRRLLAIRPPPATANNLNESEIHAAILDAVKAVTGATHHLVRAASDVQNELVAQGRSNQALNPYRRDPAWARGLISAAFAVADTTEQLVTSTNDTVKGDSGIESIVAAVRIVGGSTARLVTASRVKADPNSPSQKKLEEASRRVTKATNDLANAAKEIAKRSAAQEAETERAQYSGGAKAIAEEFRKQQEIAELEIRLSRAREKLSASHKAAYRK